MQRSNRIEAAISAYARLLKQDPRHIRALNRLGNCLMAVSKVPEAAMLFQQAVTVRPDSAVSQFNLGKALYALEQYGEAEAALRQAVLNDAGLAMGWLHLGRVLEARSKTETALACYQAAFDASEELETIPHRPGAPQELAEIIRQARRSLREKYMALHEEEMEKLQAASPGQDLTRVRKCLAIQHGREKPEFEHELHRPESIYVPGLSPQPWFERDQFSWIADFERNWESIRDEFLALEQPGVEFDPYVAAGPRVPEAMQNLAGSHSWDAFHLFVGGEEKTDNAEKVPRTIAMLRKLPLAELAGVAPEAFFSILRPGAHIRPHHGISNAKVAVHLPLIVAPQCAIRVGNETREWTAGQCLIFDDSFEHEAWNRGDSVRVVLIFEVWHPDLTESEARALTALSACIDRWTAKSRHELPTAAN